MKKIFQMIGLVSLLCLSFFYTQETVKVVKEYDDIMIKIKQESEKLDINPTNAFIKDDTIIPGISGNKVDINSSYNKMRQYGKFDSSLIIYNKVSPKISVLKNLDKYVISGNSSKKMVSLVFFVYEQDDITLIEKILDEKGVVGNFFVDGKWLEKNNKKMFDLIKAGHNIGNLSYNSDYNDSGFNWIETLIEKVGKQNVGYCYNEKNDAFSLKLCTMYKNYTIRPTLISKNPTITVKENLKSGSLLAFKITDEVEQEIGVIISYIKSKGYEIVNLEKHLEE